MPAFDARIGGWGGKRINGRQAGKDGGYQEQIHYGHVLQSTSMERVRLVQKNKLRYITAPEHHDACAGNL